VLGQQRLDLIRVAVGRDVVGERRAGRPEVDPFEAERRDLAEASSNEKSRYGTISAPSVSLGMAP
jgi:hypothetical protein